MSEILPARFADAVLLADHLRFQDAREIALAWGLGAREGLFHCLLQSERAFTVLDRGQPVALWGVSGLRESGLSIGAPWMLAGDAMFHRNRPILGRSRRVIGHLLADYDVLSNLTEASNEAHLRWLSWCGFRELRRHPSLGPAGRPFVEFYRINEHRDTAPQAVRAVLERRRPTLRAPDSAGISSRLVKLGLALLGEPGRSRVAVSEEFHDVLRSLEHGARAGGREADAPAAAGLTRADARGPGPGQIRLLLELAVNICANPRRVDARAGPATPLGDLLAALGEIADLLALNHFRAGPEVVMALAPLPPPASRGARLEPTGPGPAPSGGAAAFAALLARHLRRLTLNGCVSRMQGWRLWKAAIAGAAGEAGEVVSGRSLHEVLRSHYAARSAASANELRLSMLAERRRQILERPVSHGETVASLREVGAAAGPALADAVAEKIDGWALEGGPGRPLNTVADVVVAAGLLADGASQRLLPGLRLGGVVSGYADRHWLYRLIRAHLLEAAALDGAERELVLTDEVCGVLLASSLEDGLIRGSTDAVSVEEAHALLVRLLSMWGPGMLADDDLGHLLALLLPAAMVPAAHVVQLQPAALALHLTATGALAPALQDIGAVIDKSHSSRAAYRRLLRSLTRGVDVAAFGRQLEAMAP